PICLPSYSAGVLPAGATVNPSGWGKRSDSAGGISDVLYQTTNAVITVADCAAVYGGIITDQILCTDTTGGHGTCSG
ncbi:trypsin-like serine protease, partial [Xanthomonas citri pv. citri]|nr:trypsin-like serine protease [Xanthomonas citri pv. citri]